MKRFKRFSGLLTLAFSLLLTHLPAVGQDTSGNAHEGTISCHNADAQGNVTQVEEKSDTTDNIEISLLTCGPRDNVYSLYGHTAIRYRDKLNNIDIVINYGMFSFDKPYFVPRFVLGLTDYEMGIEDFNGFISHYEPSGCGVRQQVLNLTAEEKSKIGIALEENYRKENRTYRYNYFYKNCTTEARDIILNNISGTVNYNNACDSSISFRRIMHDCTENHRWARFGNDLLLGFKADAHTTRDMQQFLPANLMNDFSNASIRDGKGTRMLVKEEFWLLTPVEKQKDNGSPLTPMTLLTAVAAIVIAATVAEMRGTRNFWILDLVMHLMCGACGLVLGIMIFSKHPTVNVNFQILMLNPLLLVFAWHTIKHLRKGMADKWLMAWTAMIYIMVIESFWQTYAEGMLVLALSLLFRNNVKIYLPRKRTLS